MQTYEGWIVVFVLQCTLVGRLQLCRDKFLTKYDLIKCSRYYINVSQSKRFKGRSHTVWPDWAIYWTLGKFLKPLATQWIRLSIPSCGTESDSQTQHLWCFFQSWYKKDKNRPSFNKRMFQSNCIASIWNKIIFFERMIMPLLHSWRSVVWGSGCVFPLCQRFTKFWGLCN